MRCASLLLTVSTIATIPLLALRPAAAAEGDKPALTTADMLKETPEQRDRRMAWWRDARFGMFLHWGPVSITGKELSWSRQGPRPGDQMANEEIPTAEYDSLYKRFNPTEFNADQWVKIAKDAGMKYMVFTAKHHDGFSNFHTKLSDYNIANSPFKRDIVKELADACHKGGLRFGIYYSTRDWYHPDYLNGDNSRYNDFYHGQVRELLSNYGKVDVMWFDHVGGNWGDYRFEELFSMIKQLQPEIVINNRAAAFFFPTNDQPSPELARLVAADFDTPEQKLGHFNTSRAWESCITLVGGQWSYKPEGKMFTLPECIRMLVQCVTGDGNLLLNIGPMPTGQIEPRQVDRLREMGDWLNKYGESVYGTRGGPLVSGDWGGATQKGDMVYLHIMKWDNDQVRLPALPRKFVRASVLTGGTATVTHDDQGLLVSMPAKEQNEIDTIIKLELEPTSF